MESNTGEKMTKPMKVLTEEQIHNLFPDVSIMLPRVRKLLKVQLAQDQQDCQKVITEIFGEIGEKAQVGKEKLK